MQKRKPGNRNQVSTVGLGCMGKSSAPYHLLDQILADRGLLASLGADDYLGGALAAIVWFLVKGVDEERNFPPCVS